MADETKTKIWVVVGGWDYSGLDQPEAAFKCLADAEDYAAKMRKRRHWGVKDYDDVQIVELELE